MYYRQRALLLMLTARSRRTKQVLISSFGVDEGSSSETLEHGVGRYATPPVWAVGTKAKLKIRPRWSGNVQKGRLAWWGLPGSHGRGPWRRWKARASVPQEERWVPQCGAGWWRLHPGISRAQRRIVHCRCCLEKEGATQYLVDF